MMGSCACNNCNSKMCKSLKSNHTTNTQPFTDRMLSSRRPINSIKSLNAKYVHNNKTTKFNVTNSLLKAWTWLLR